MIIDPYKNFLDLADLDPETDEYSSTLAEMESILANPVLLRNRKEYLIALDSLAHEVVSRDDANYVSPLSESQLENLVRYGISDSIALAEEAIQLNDSDTQTMFSLVRLYGVDGRAEEGLSIGDAWQRRFPEDPNVYFAQDTALAYLGRFEDANEALQEAQFAFRPFPWRENAPSSDESSALPNPARKLSLAR